MSGVLPKNVQLNTTTALDIVRDRTASRLANWALKIATPEYRSVVDDLLHRGAEALLRDRTVAGAELVARAKGRRP